MIKSLKEYLVKQIPDKGNCILIDLFNHLSDVSDLDLKTVFKSHKVHEISNKKDFLEYLKFFEEKIRRKEVSNSLLVIKGKKMNDLLQKYGYIKAYYDCKVLSISEYLEKEYGISLEQKEEETISLKKVLDNYPNIFIYKTRKMKKREIASREKDKELFDMIVKE